MERDVNGMKWFGVEVRLGGMSGTKSSVGWAHHDAEQVNFFCLFKQEKSLLLGVAP